MLLSRVFPEPDGALLAGSGVCEQEREREYERERMAWHGRPGRRDSRQRAGQDSSEGELGWGRSAALQASRRNSTKTNMARRDNCRSDRRRGVPSRWAWRLTDAAGRSKVQSRDFVVVRSATRV